MKEKWYRAVITRGITKTEKKYYGTKKSVSEKIKKEFSDSIKSGNTTFKIFED